MLYTRIEHYFWTIPSFDISIKRAHIFVKHVVILNHKPYLKYILN